MVRNSLRYVNWKQRKSLARDLRAVYSAAARGGRDRARGFSKAWDDRYPMVSKQWRANWTNLTAFFDYPPAIRRVIYTTNGIESIQAQLRK